MTLTTRPRLLIRFAVLAALALCGIVLALSSTGTPPVGAQDGSAPAKPTGVVTTATHDSVALAWDDPGDASITHYQIFRRDRDVHDAGEFVTIEENTGSAAASYTDDTVEPETRYVYRVKAVNQHGASTWSNFVRADTPAAPDPADLAPSGLEVSLVENRVTLTWDAPASDAASVTGYEILRRRPNDGEAALTTLVADTGNAETGYTDDTANEPGVRYTYMVRALRDGEQSRVSNFAPIDLPDDYAQDTSGSDEPTPTPEALAPSGLTAEAAKDGGVALSWAAPAEDAGSVTGYEVLRAQGSAELATLAADTGSTDTAYADETATAAGETYAYQVKALRGEEKSQGSNKASIDLPDDKSGQESGDLARADEEVLVSNTGQSNNGYNTITSTTPKRAQAFTTGTNELGYTLSSIGISFGTISSDSNPTSELTATLNKVDGSNPGDVICTLTDPASYVASSVNTYQAPATRCPTLTASTTYFFVLSRANDTTSTIQLDRTNSNSEDADPAVGWSIADNRRFFTSGAWTPPDDPTAHRIAVTGAAVDDATMVVPPPTEVPSTWSLIPGGLGVGDEFRLLFLSSTKRSIRSTNISDYNTFVQNRAAAGHTDIQDYSDTFRVLGSTDAKDARDNTGTTYTSSDKDVRIYWLNGDKAADQYEDFYDGSWDQQADAWNESGVEYNLSARRYVATGSSKDGTTDQSNPLGASSGEVQLGCLYQTSSINGPVSCNFTTENISADNNQQLYGLSGVFQVTTNNATGKPTISGTPEVKQTLTADVSGIMDADGLPADDQFSYQWVRNDGTDDSDISGATDSTYKLQAADLGKTIKVKVTFTDGGGTEETLTSDATTAVAADTTGPVVEQVVCFDSFCNLFFDEPVDGNPDHSPPTIAFAITADGAAITVGSVFPGVQGSARAGALAPQIRQGQTVKIVYTDPTSGDDTNAIQDAAGNDASDFTTGEDGVPAVTNNSTVAPVAPGAPTGLTATASGGTQIDLAWTAPADNGGRVITGYQIEKSDDAGTRWSVLVADTQSTDTIYSDTTLSGGETRHYRVSAINSIGTGAASNSPPTGKPVITGTPEVNQTLTADISGIMDADGLPADDQFSYQWIRSDGTDDSDISGATDSTYKLKAADLGKTIKVKVTFTDGGGTEETLTSAATTAVAADTTGPVVEQVVCFDSFCNLFFDEPVDGNPDHSPPTIAFAITADGAAITVGSVFPGVQGSARASTLAPLIRQGQTVKIVYTDPTSGDDTNAIQDAAGHDAADFTTGEDGVPAVTNNSTVAPVAPGAPTSLTATASGGTQIDLAWTAPADNGGRVVEGYQIEYSDDAGTSWSVLVADTQTTDTMYSDTTLSGGETRHYRVSAINSIDTGAASTVADATTPSGPGVASVTVDQASITQTTAAVTVTVANLQNDLHTVYLRYRAEGGVWPSVANQSTPTSGAAITFTLTGLTGNTAHYVAVSLDSGFASGVKTATFTTSPTKPGQTTGVNFTLKWNGVLAISWIAPQNDGGSAITGYKVQWKSGSQSFGDPSREHTTGASARVYTITGLTNGTEYTVRVIAVNAVGDGPPSNEKTATPVGPPDAPPNVQAGSGHQQLTVNWGAPNDRGSAITEYTLQWKSGGQGFNSSRQRTIAAPSRTDTIPSLDNGTEYTVRVKATTALGDSGWSAEAKGTPSSKPPPSVTITTGADQPIDGPFAVTITFNEEVEGFACADEPPDPNEVACDIGAGYVGGALVDVVDLQEVGVNANGEHVFTARVEDILTGTLVVWVHKGKVHAVDGGLPNAFGALQVEVKALDQVPQQPVTTVWQASMDVEDVGGYLGYAKTGGLSGGSLTGDTFTWSGQEYTVEALLYNQAIGEVILELSRALPNDGRRMALLIGNYWLDTSNPEPYTHTVAGKDGWGYRWHPVAPYLEAGHANVPVKLVRQAIGASSAQGQAFLSWSDPGDDTITGYRIERRDRDGDEGFTALVDDTGSDDTGYTDRSVEGGGRYAYRVTAMNDAGESEPSGEAHVDVPARPNSPARGAPTISGTAQAGETLTADTDGIEDDDGLADAVYTYQWLADDADIAGATSDTYTPVADDVGKAINVKVSFRDDRNHQESLTSAATAAATAAADESAVWSAALTVGSIAGYLGFWKDVGMGELTSEVFTLDGVDYTVKVLADSDGPQFYLTLDKALPVGFTLQVGATTLSSQGTSIREFSSGATQYGWATNQGAILADVDTVEVSLTRDE